MKGERGEIHAVLHLEQGEIQRDGEQARGESLAFEGYATASN